MSFFLGIWGFELRKSEECLFSGPGNEIEGPHLIPHIENNLAKKWGEEEQFEDLSQWSDLKHT